MPDPTALPNNSAAEKKRLQMADIARLAGVSVATVSRALSRSPLVSEETRTRIEELAQSLNYTINVGAQNLRLKQNRTIAVVIPFDQNSHQRLSDPFFLSMLGSLADALTEQGYEMLLSRVSADQLASSATSYDTGRAIGIILIGQWRHHEQLNQLAARRVPIVVWGAQMPQQLYCTVGSNNVSGGFLASQHLLQTGCRRIVFLGDVNLPEVALRHEGYLAALAKHGIDVDPALTVTTSFLPASGRQAMQDLIHKEVQFDGIFASSDLLAMAAINVMREHGVKTPRDVAVVGYDDIDLATHFHPPLTTIRQPIEAAGHALVDALLKLVEGNKASPQLLPTELVIRATTNAHS